MDAMDLQNCAATVGRLCEVSFIAERLVKGKERLILSLSIIIFNFLFLYFNLINHLVWS